MKRRNIYLLIIFIFSAAALVFWCIYAYKNDENSIYGVVIASVWIAAFPAAIVYFALFIQKKGYKIIYLWWLWDLIILIPIALSPFLAILYIRKSLYEFLDSRRGE